MAGLCALKDFFFHRAVTVMQAGTKKTRNSSGRPNHSGGMDVLNLHMGNEWKVMLFASREERMQVRGGIW